MTIAIITRCPREGCTQDPDPKSTKGYCAKHKAEAREIWRNQISESRAEAEAKRKRWEDLHIEAHRAGVRAGNACEEMPMAGQAWVVVRPASCSYARYLMTNTRSHKGHGGGVEVWVSEFNGFYERRLAYARAYATVVREALAEDAIKGFSVYATGRLD